MVPETYEPNGPSLPEPRDLVGVFEGNPPVKGVLEGPATLTWWSGDAEAARAVANGHISLLDEIIHLEAVDGRVGWALVRRHLSGPRREALVVEDDETNRAFYTEVLSDIGLVVHAAATAAEALRIAGTRPLSLAVVDVRLPDANGFEVCRALGADRPLQDCVMLMMSADPLWADNDRIEAVGAAGFVLNPVTPVDLARRVFHLLGARAPRDEQAESRPAPVGSQPSVCLSFFGRPAVVVDGVATPLRAGQSTVLLATLAAACPTAVSSERLGRSGWRSETEVSTNAVYTAVSRLRHLLAEAGAPDLLASDGSGYRLDLSPLNIDVVRFEVEARALRRLPAGPPAEALEAIRLVLDLWTGDPFAGTNNEALTRWSNRLLESRSRLIETKAALLVLAGEAGPAVEVCRDLLLEEPWREFLWATLIIALYRAGRSRDALTAFGLARRRLQEELGLDPGPLLGDLERMILNHDPSLRDDEWFERAAAGSPLSGGDRSAAP